MKKVLGIAFNFTLQFFVIVCALTILSRMIAVFFLLEKYQNIVSLLEACEPLFTALGNVPIIL